MRPENFESEENNFRRRRVGTISGMGAILFMLACSVLLFANGAIAMPFSPDITVDGVIEFDEGFSTGASGSFSATQAGVTTTSTFSGATVDSGTDPIMAAFTNLNDGFGLTTDVTASMRNESGVLMENEFGVGIDFFFNLANTSLDDYEVGFRVDFSNLADADGADAYADSELTVDDLTGERFFTHIVSDTFFNDERNGVDLATSGDMISDSGVFDFYVSLSGGASEVVAGMYTLEGGVFDALASESTTAHLRASIAIFDVKNLTNPPTPNPVPEPGTLMLLGVGLVGMTLVVRGHRRTRSAQSKQ